MTDTTTTSPAAECINLKQRFGKRFKVDYEESYFAERSIRSVEDPWLMVMPCRAGHIFPWGGTRLAFAVDTGHTQLAGIMRRLPCCETVQDGDDGEVNASFDVADFDEVAAIVRPRRRPQLSDEQRDRLREHMLAVRERSATQKNRDRIAPESPAGAQEVFRYPSTPGRRSTVAKTASRSGGTDSRSSRR